MTRKERPTISYNPFEDPELIERAGNDIEHLRLLAERKWAAFAFNRVDPTDNEGMRVADSAFSVINEAIKVYERGSNAQQHGSVASGAPE